MEQIWNILELEPTQDVTAIKRAYARLSQKYHPEENPEMFLKLRKAYQAALAQAEESPQAPDEPPVSDSADTDNGWIIPDKSEESGPNPFLEHEANRQFTALYCGKQRKNPKNWMDYFTSSAFLEAAWNPDFSKLLLQNVTEMKQEYPPTKEFLTWLYIAYQFTACPSIVVLPDGKEERQLQFRLYENANFDGIDSIFRIAAMGPIPKRPTGNELAILTSFSEYRHLVKLAENGSWNEQAIGEFSHIIGRYVLSYIKDKCLHREFDAVERHPAGLRVLIHFFECYELPEELYRILWTQLDLKNAVMGRTKLFYGRLRELVIEHVPEIENEAVESFRQLQKDFTAYGIGFRQHGGADLQKDREEIDAFFAREDFQRALLNRRFVENYIRIWVNERRSEYFLQRIIDFYRTHENAPYAEQVIEHSLQMLKLRNIRKQTEEDQKAPVPERPLTLACRPFFRHWLNTGFYTARNPENGRPLADYLNSELPYVPEWSRRFLSFDEDGSLPVPRCLVADFGEIKIEIRFHLRYMDFLVNGEAAYRPFLNWDWVKTISDSNLFFFLLPVTVSSYDRYETAKTEIIHRLANTAAPEESREFLASCLASQVCCLPVTDDSSKMPPLHTLLPFVMFMEDSEKLYGCSWFEPEQTLLFFEQTSTGRRIVPSGEYEQICSEAAAITLARQLLTEAVSPSGIHVDLLNPLPDAVYALPDFAAISRDPKRTGSDMPRELLAHEVTPEPLETLFMLFAEGKIIRLELSWECTIPMEEHQGYQPRRSLVFIKDPAGYACLYFDDDSAQSYALLAHPELYYHSEHTELNLVRFRQGKLFNHNIHNSFSTIRQHLDTIFKQASYPKGITLHAGHLWSSTISVKQGRHKYNLDKQLLGGFPVSWAHNRPASRFYFAVQPASMAWIGQEGQPCSLMIDNRNRDLLQQTLLSFLQGKIPKMQLTWGSTEQQHLILLSDNSRFMMVYLEDKKQSASFYVADVKTYRNVEGKKYPKDTFLGRTTPAYLIHSDPIVFRNGVELMLASISEPSVITDVFAAFASENPVKPRPYDVIRAELLIETQ